MISSLSNIFTLSLGLAALARAQFDEQLVGTWTTKSRKVLTGPGFYNPVEDRFIEPELAGISYSFTADGFFESAYYRAVANPTTPQCPSAVLQWQHGTYTIGADGSINMTPFGVDGRQLTSSPCSYDEAIYIRYDQPEKMERYEVRTDPFHNVPRLNLFRFNGVPVQPLYKHYLTPQMLPTQTLNPTSTPSATAGSKLKRGLGGADGLSQQILEPMGKPGLVKTLEPFNADKIWWAGVGLTAVGTVMYIATSS
ncbi:hypothetical protein PV10_04927 [Exophiala mesophila]|uniref:Protein ROT1 n=1 Tax=Exophiala mesophila TaxID=212818 RepID=A0A0D2A3Z7_EXOME|nr:uncharacterized protein PV10_04927 [Exophiala mesophila]KIV93733.1 hypothetical protein PV10_04927 [Exophiala mesophila]